MTRNMNSQDNAQLDDALAGLRKVAVPPIDSAHERALLAAFDQHWAAPRTTTSRWIFAAAAALGAVVLALNWTSAAIRRPDGRGTAPSFSLDGFVAWPGADAWPPFESGSVVRVELPATALSGLGLVAAAPAATLVQADIIVGQDGLTRAVRLVQQERNDQ